MDFCFMDNVADQHLASGFATGFINTKPPDPELTGCRLSTKFTRNRWSARVCQGNLTKKIGSPKSAFPPSCRRNFTLLNSTMKPNSSTSFGRMRKGWCFLRASPAGFSSLVSFPSWPPTSRHPSPCPCPEMFWVGDGLVRLGQPGARDSLRLLHDTSSARPTPDLSYHCKHNASSVNVPSIIEPGKFQYHIR